MLLTSFCFVLSALAANACTDDQLNTCDTNQCETLGTTQICIQCKTAGHVPINGVCKQQGDEVSNAGCKNNAGAEISTEKTCGQCDGAYFLYKGGCYGTNNEIGQKLCTEATGGICTAAATGYFVPPNAQKTDQSVISCFEETQLTVNTKNFKGVPKCLICDPPTTTTANPNLPTCTVCEDGTFVDSDGAVCTQCSDVDCAKCNDGANKCTKCKTKYLKITDANTGVSECVDADTCKAGNSYYQDDTGTIENGKLCRKCDESVTGCNKCTSTPISDVRTTTVIKCTECTSPDANKPNVAGTGCFTCSIENCSNCSENGICEKCGSSKKVSPGKKSCIEKCPENSTDTESVCVCNSGYGPDSAGTGCVTVSTNLSTGAIAGISVAAIVVVGGLVGFLCWWFICRGKA
ncbi:Hypothetical protein GLP15_1877 [Giardia lamblia P15]|uniref:VSP n=1 Tax=Giardia intestinalis (strain P15) TaxID=658858 RepID=E1F2E8_GIAIA|nr:Hypothetical protein GLP15_1877 [Giardia lamblia P15]